MWIEKKLLDVTSEACGYTNGKPRHSETWWWNKDVDVAVSRKREFFVIVNFIFCIFRYMNKGGFYIPPKI